MIAMFEVCFEVEDGERRKEGQYYFWDF